jgi:hypothetical protein
MAKLDNSIYGSVSGKLGPVVGATWKGKPYLRTRPSKRGKKRGVNEKLNQTRFSQAHYWLQPLLQVLRIGFNNYSPTIVGFNAAKSYCLNNSFTGEGAARKVDPALVRVSFGDLPLPESIEMKLGSDNLLQFKWDNRPGGGNHYDQAMLVAYDTANRMATMKLTGQFRMAGADELRIPKKGNFQVYIAFVSHDRTRQSHSVYLGEVGK